MLVCTGALRLFGLPWWTGANCGKASAWPPCSHGLPAIERRGGETSFLTEWLTVACLLGDDAWTGVAGTKFATVKADARMRAKAPSETESSRLESRFMVHPFYYSCLA